MAALILLVLLLVQLLIQDSLLRSSGNSLSAHVVGTKPHFGTNIEQNEDPRMIPNIGQIEHP